MKLLRLFSYGIVFAVLAASLHGVAGAATFIYHGSLQDSGKPAEGSYDLELTLYASAGGGRVIGGPLVLYKVPVHQGSFSTQADFGSLADIAGTAWLEVKVRSAGSGEFAALSARAPVSAADTASVCPGAWTLDGNAGTAPGTGAGQNYLGTADNQPLVLAINGAQAARWIPSGNSMYPDSTNVELGSSGNFVGAGVAGASVGGGGDPSLSNCGPSSDQPCVNSATNDFTAVGGGFFNTASGLAATVAGGDYNAASGDLSSVGGGFYNNATGASATVAGGYYNFSGGDYSMIAGGTHNSASGNFAVIAGGDNNYAAGTSSAVGGGRQNQASADDTTIGGGINNQATAEGATIAGGSGGVASGLFSGVLGGEGNVASGIDSAVVSGYFNQAQASDAVVCGGAGNQASGYESSVPGGYSNLAGGDYSFAAGQGANARAPAGGCVTGFCGDYGTFVWSDGSTSSFTSSGPDQFLIQAVGGVAINTTPVNSSVELTIAAEPYNSDYVSMYLRQATINAGILISSGAATSSQANNAVFTIDQYNGTTQKHVMAIDAAGNTLNITGAWTMFSDRRLKRDIGPIDHPLDTFLALHGETFAYIDPARAMAQPGRRMGFIAQDVETVLPQWVGEDERGYKMVTPTGFEALSVEALRELRAEKDAQIEILQNKLDDLSARLSRLEAVPGP
ncbi:MAG: tail fiber domain-containing protein [Rudaea sp.]